MACASALSAAVCTAMDRLPGDAALLGHRHEEAQEKEDRAVKRGPRRASRPASCPRACCPADPGAQASEKSACAVARHEGSQGGGLRRAQGRSRRDEGDEDVQEEKGAVRGQEQGHLGAHLGHRAGVEEGEEARQHPVHREDPQGGAAAQGRRDFRPP